MDDEAWIGADDASATYRYSDCVPRMRPLEETLFGGSGHLGRLPAVVEIRILPV